MSRTLLTLGCVFFGVAEPVVGGEIPSAEPPTSAIVAAPAELSTTRAALLERVRRGEATSLAVGVSRSGKVIWEEALGWANREAGTPATAETLYPVASVSKSITGTGALALIASGVLRLDQPVQPILGSLRLPRVGESPDGVLVSHLLAHTSGIPHLWHYEYSDRPETVVGRGRLIRDYAFIAAPPGERFLYSNLGFGVLAEVIEKTGHASFQRVMDGAVFRPLGMHRTTVDSWVGEKSVVQGYDSGGKVIPYKYRLAPDGGAGFFSNVEELLRYGQFHAGGSEIRSLPRSVAVATALGELPPGKHYLRGWGVVGLKDATVLISDGETAGGTAVVVLVPEKQLVVVVLCNQTGGPATDSSVAILSALIPNFGELFGAAAGAIDAEMSKPGALPAGRLQGILSDASSPVPVSLDFGSPSAPLLRFGDTTHLLQVAGWDGGAFQATVEGWLPVGAGKGRTHRLILTLWPHQGGLQGVAQEDFFEDRPRFGVPHFVRLEPSPGK